MSTASSTMRVYRRGKLIHAEADLLTAYRIVMEGRETMIAICDVVPPYRMLSVPPQLLLAIVAREVRRRKE